MIAIDFECLQSQLQWYRSTLAQHILCNLDRITDDIVAACLLSAHEEESAFRSKIAVILYKVAELARENRLKFARSFAPLDPLRRMALLTVNALEEDRAAALLQMHREAQAACLASRNFIEAVNMVVSTV